MTTASLTGQLAAAAARITSSGFRHGRGLYDTLPDLRRDVADITAAANDAEEPGPGLHALFAGIIEPWSDSFQPMARDAYGVVFADIVWRTAANDQQLLEALHAAGLHGPEDIEAGWQRRRDSSLPWPTDPQNIAILSRVTLGADILLVSTLIQHLRQRYPQATLNLIGAGKLQDLFGACPNLTFTPVTYARRGPLRERLHSWLAIREATANADLIVSPDSRLDQLGMLPLTKDPAAHRLWENTLPDGVAMPLAAGLDHWCQQQLGTDSHTPALWPSQATLATAEKLRQATSDKPLLAVKLDVGGNPAKALPIEFERDILRTIVNRGWRVILDRGFGNAELAASDRLLASLGWQAVDLADDPKMGLTADSWSPETFASGDCLRLHGTIGSWAAAVMAAQYAFAYDSVGQHLAAAADTPVLVAFAGFADDRFPVAWQPCGKNTITTLRVPPATKSEILAAIPHATATN